MATEYLSKPDSRFSPSEEFVLDHAFFLYFSPVFDSAAALSATGINAVEEARDCGNMPA